MFSVDEMPESHIWALGDFAGTKRSKKAVARADLAATFIEETGLKIIPDAKDHPRHVNVCEWPTSKDEQKALALELCAKSTLFVRPE